LLILTITLTWRMCTLGCTA